MKKYIPIVFLSFRTDNTQNLSSVLIMWTYYFLFFNTHWWNSLSLLFLFLYLYSFLFFRGFFDDINNTFEIPLSNLLIFSYRKPKMLRRIIYKKVFIISKKSLSLWSRNKDQQSQKCHHIGQTNCNICIFYLD